MLYKYSKVSSCQPPGEWLTINEGGWSAGLGVCGYACSYSRVAAELRPVRMIRTLHMVRILESVIVAVERGRNVGVDWRFAVLRRLDSRLRLKGSLPDSTSRVSQGCG